jgi:hypothetical protein
MGLVEETKGGGKEGEKGVLFCVGKLLNNTR